MTRQWLAGLVLVRLLLPVYSWAQDKPTAIRLTVKYNARTVMNPDHIVLSASDYARTVTVANGKFNAPREILQAKSFRLSADVAGSHIEIVELSPGEFLYEDWTLLLADHRYPEDYGSSVPKGADIRRSCMLVLDSEHLDPGIVIFQDPCRTRSHAPSW